MQTLTVGSLFHFHLHGLRAADDVAIDAKWQLSNFGAARNKERRAVTQRCGWIGEDQSHRGRRIGQIATGEWAGNRERRLLTPNTHIGRIARSKAINDADQ